MKNILIILLIIIIFIILKYRNEHFTLNTLSKLPQDVERNKPDVKYEEGLYVIDSIFYRQTSPESRLYLRIDEKGDFAFRHSNKEELTEEEKTLLKDYDNNLRIDNGIFIKKTKKGTTGGPFTIQPTKYDLNNDKVCKNKNLKYNINFIQYYNKEDDNKEEENKIKYFITENNRFLYVDEDSTVNGKIKHIMRTLEMKDICKNEDSTDKYKYKGNKFYKGNDTNTKEDKDFNRDYNDIPSNNICPEEFPLACSGEGGWRNHCTKRGKDRKTGICNTFNTNNTFKINYPVRNFNCKGFKCHNTKIKKTNIENNPSDDHCISPKEFIEKQTDGTYKLAGIELEKFLFYINSYKCNVTTTNTEDPTGNSYPGISFCKNHSILEVAGNHNRPQQYFDKVEIKRKGKCTGEKIQISNNLNKISDDEYELCISNTNSDNREGITKLKFVGFDESCNNYKNYPENWTEAINTDELVGCYGYNTLFNFQSNSTKENNKEDCKTKAGNKDYYAYNDNTKDCYVMDNIPTLVKFKNVDPCNSNGNLGNEFEDLKKIKIYKSEINEQQENKKNVIHSRIYEEFYYKIINTDNNLEYQFNTDKKYLEGKDYEKLSNTEKNTIKFERVDPISDTFTPLKYNEEVYITFVVNEKENYLKLNKIDPNIDRLLISIDDDDGSYYGLNTAVDYEKDVKIGSGKYRPIKFGYGLKEYERNTKNEHKFYCSYLVYPYKSYGDRNINSGNSEAHKSGSQTCSGESTRLYNIDTGDQGSLPGRSGFRPLFKPYSKPEEYSKYKFSNLNSGCVALWPSVGNGSISDIPHNKALTIINALTKWQEGHKKKSARRYRQHFRAYIPYNFNDPTKNEAHRFVHGNNIGSYGAGYNNENYIRNTIADKYLVPSKINDYILRSKDGGKTALSNIKIENGASAKNYSFIVNDTKDTNRLSFRFISSKKSPGNSDFLNFSDNYVNINEDLYLYNAKFKILLSLNEHDEKKNSFIGYSKILVDKITSWKTPNYRQTSIINNIHYSIKKHCKLQVKMIKKNPSIHSFSELRKVCYKKEPFMTNNIVNAQIQEEKGKEDIKINEDALLNLFLDKQYISELENKKFKPKTNNTPHTPYPKPIPKL